MPVILTILGLVKLQIDTPNLGGIKLD